jgi:hypothetical protein
MLLTPQDAKLFFTLHRALMLFVNQRLKAVPDHPASPEDSAVLASEIRLKVRDALLDHSDLIESFVDQNPAQLPDDELAIVRAWRHLVAGKFYILRELKKYTVFLSSENQRIAYGVRALSQPFEELIGPYLPVLTQTVLLPFKDMIVYDGLLSSYRISFGILLRQQRAERRRFDHRRGKASGSRSRQRVQRAKTISDRGASVNHLQPAGAGTIPHCARPHSSPTRKF